MPDKWVIDTDHPEGHLVPLTPEEEAQQALDIQAGSAQAAVEETANTNRTVIAAKAQAALAVNVAYLALPPIPGGALTLLQLSTAVRAIRDQTDLLTRESNAVIRLLLGALDTTSGT